MSGQDSALGNLADIRPYRQDRQRPEVVRRHSLPLRDRAPVPVLRTEGLYPVAWPPGSEWRNRRLERRVRTPPRKRMVMDRNSGSRKLRARGVIKALSTLVFSGIAVADNIER